MWIYYWEKYGYLRAQQLFLSDYKKDKGHVLKGVPNLANVLAGKLDFLKMVKGKNDSTYEKLKGRFDSLNLKNNFITEILDIWENEGIDSAMKKFYIEEKSEVKSPQLNNNVTIQKEGSLNLELLKSMGLDLSEPNYIPEN
jgi:hypothetical protein